MFLKIVGLFFLVIATSASHMRMKDRTGDPDLQLLPAKPKNPPELYDRTEWGAMTMCPDYSFARAFKQYKNGLLHTVYGLSQIEFYCRMPYYGKFCDGQNCGWKKSGLPGYGNTNLGLLECPHPRQFLIGIQVAFGNQHEGAWNMTVICDVPNWNTTPEAKAGNFKPHAVKLGPRPGMQSFGDISKAQKARKAHQADDNDSHATGHREERDLRMRDASRVYGDVLKCDPGNAICGFSTKTGNGLNVGIMEISALCCPFPAWTSD